MKNHTKIILFLSFILILVFLFLIQKYIKNTYCEGFLDTKYEKTICLVWRNKIQNDTHQGFGDKFRGAISLYQYCKIKNINLKIDANHDVCGDFLKNVTLTNENITKDTPLVNNDNISNKEMYKTLDKELINKNIIYVFSNAVPNENLDEDDKDFAKFICEPKSDLQKEVNAKIKNLPKHYGIQHFRFHDNAFKKDVDSNDKLFKKFFELLKNSYKPTDVLFTNSNNFKKYAIEQLGIQTIDCNGKICNISHIGHSNDQESVKNSFVEFFIVQKSNYIKTYSCYPWASNFVKWPALIYDIPLENTYVDEKIL
jgi:hypothetical protein